MIEEVACKLRHEKWKHFVRSFKLPRNFISTTIYDNINSLRKLLIVRLSFDRKRVTLIDCELYLVHWASCNFLAFCTPWTEIRNESAFVLWELHFCSMSQSITLRKWNWSSRRIFALRVTFLDALCIEIFKRNQSVTNRKQTCMYKTTFRLTQKGSA